MTSPVFFRCHTGVCEDFVEFQGIRYSNLFEEVLVGYVSAVGSKTCILAGFVVKTLGSTEIEIHEFVARQKWRFPKIGVVIIHVNEIFP